MIDCRNWCEKSYDRNFLHRSQWWKKRFETTLQWNTVWKGLQFIFLNSVVFCIHTILHHSLYFCFSMLIKGLCAIFILLIYRTVLFTIRKHFYHCFLPIIFLTNFFNLFQCLEELGAKTNSIYGCKILLTSMNRFNLYSSTAHFINVFVNKAVIHYLWSSATVSVCFAMPERFVFVHKRIFKIAAAQFWK